MTDHTKHLSFEFIVPSEFFNASVKVTVAYVIPVRYTLNWKKEVAVEGYTVKPGMAQHIVNWEGLEREMLAAAVNNAEDYRVPGDWFLVGRSVPEAVSIPSPHENSFYE